jgi:hypothetical protein
MQAVAQEHTGVDFLKKQRFQPRRMGSFWFGGVLVFVCVELAAAEWPTKRTYDREHGGRWPIYGALIL